MHKLRTRLSYGFGLLGVVLALGSPIYALHAIDTERARNTRDACVDQNRRHDATLHELRRLVAKLPPKRQAQAKHDMKGTVLLINALAPHQNCDDLVKRRVGA